MFCRYYPHFVEISTSRVYFPHFVDIIYINHITSYLARNVCTIFHIYLFSESDWCKERSEVPKKRYDVNNYKLEEIVKDLNTLYCCLFLRAKQSGYCLTVQGTTVTRTVLYAT